MVCPYNGFKEMDCEQCAAYEVIDPMLWRVEDNGEKITPVMEHKCRLAWCGAPVPSDIHVSYEGIHFHPNKVEQWRQLAEDYSNDCQIKG